ncbi:MAG: flagellar basal-body MS-ring/collar protein FliF [Georgenia sp.]
MPAAVTGFVGRIKGYWDQFSLPQRTIATLVVALIVLGVVALSLWASKPRMAPVFSNLSAEDAAAVVDQLATNGVPYELADGGATVLVPQDQLYDQRISLAASGLPTSRDGYALLDDMGLTSSDFQQQITYQRALEGELAATIEAMRGVAGATVHLALPEDSVFVDQVVAPTASVFVQLETGQSLDAAGVQAIINLVSSSIPDMQPGGVSVIDAAGQVLSDAGSGTGPGGASDYEKDVTSSVQAMLDRVVGPGNAVVSVQADLNRDATERLSETFTPADGTPPLSESSSTEEYTGTGGAVGGVLGPDNIAVPGNGGGDGTYTRADQVLNNPVNKVTEQTTVNPGGVARQSVSVVVDADAGAGLSLTELERMVTAAAGIDPARGDQVAVSRMAFDTSAADAAAQALAAADAAAAAAAKADLIRQGIIAGVVLLVVLLIALVARRARRERREEIELGELRLLQAQQFQAIQEEADEIGQGPETLSPPPAQIEILRTQADDAREELSVLASDDPAVVARQLRDWLAVR